MPALLAVPIRRYREGSQSAEPPGYDVFLAVGFENKSVDASPFDCAQEDPEIRSLRAKAAQPDARQELAIVLGQPSPGTWAMVNQPSGITPTLPAGRACDSLFY